jgi:hypothetical protein
MRNRRRDGYYAFAAGWSAQSSLQTSRTQRKKRCWMPFSSRCVFICDASSVDLSRNHCLWIPYIGAPAPCFARTITWANE